MWARSIIARSGGAYCNRTCAVLARRKMKTKAQKVEEKRVYDARYRVSEATRLKIKKAAYFQRTYNPVEAAIIRKARMPYHVEYCRQPAYREKKTVYDLNRRAAAYGEFAEAYKLLLEVDREVNSRMTDHEVRVANGTMNKRLQRKRDYA